MNDRTRGQVAYFRTLTMHVLFTVFYFTISSSCSRSHAEIIFNRCTDIKEFVSKIKSFSPTKDKDTFVYKLDGHQIFKVHISDESAVITTVRGNPTYSVENVKGIFMETYDHIEQLPDDSSIIRYIVVTDIVGGSSIIHATRSPDGKIKRIDVERNQINRLCRIN
ncbi:hypothetical protein MKK70_26720 [Methylobacterium sp. E-041]|uniref:hypothetical protein n=1 Tax=Methylobacterium sp. E-041 TaxID=2836573 RepID=UPI001FBB9FC0|nr:hypothetical protein [Methylobacterium sp. E-041]MCJ2108904.1 hypothetical protein [Methylobacterium sp. E-041]